ncbi:hypothetical protein IGI04_043048, partial [Brassica rapa subsp. trilocularis]
MDALIKMLKENGNTYGYSFGASMIAKTIETSHCVADIARMDRVKNNEQARHEIQMWGGGTNMRVLLPLLKPISHLTLIVRGKGTLKLKKMVHGRGSLLFTARDSLSKTRTSQSHTRKLPLDPNVGRRNQHESSPAPVEANQSPHLDREGGRDSETQEDGQDGTGLSEEEEESVSGSHNQGDQSQGEGEAQAEAPEP